MRLARWAAAALRPSRRQAAPAGPTVTAALASLQRSGAITPAVYQKDYSAYVAAVNSLKKLSGTRRNELGAVVANVQAIAAAGGFIPSRLPALFLTLERNRTWWTSGSLLASRVRISFPGSKLMWEYYAGQGIEIQWLGTFGEGNGYYSGGQNNNLKQLVSELIPLATKRAGGIAWEYMFQFDGGLPPWTSGLSQGTALQVLSRDWSRFKEPAVLTAAQEALGIFKTPPPSGVRVRELARARTTSSTPTPPPTASSTAKSRRSSGSTTTPRSRRTPSGWRCSKPATPKSACARRSTTPAPGRCTTSTANRTSTTTNCSPNSCSTCANARAKASRSRAAPAPAPAPAPATPVTPTTPTTTTPGGTAGGPGARRKRAATRWRRRRERRALHGAGRSATTTGRVTSTASPTRHAIANAIARRPLLGAIAGDAIYCTTAEALHRRICTRRRKIALITTTLPTSSRAGVQLSLSKISTVHLTVRLGGKVVYSNSATVERGKPKLLWPTPSKGGSYAVTLTATDLAGNFATASGTITVAKGAKAH